MVRETRRRAATLRRTGSQGQWRADIRVATRLVSRHVHSGAIGLQRSLEPRSPEHGSASISYERKETREFRSRSQITRRILLLTLLFGLSSRPEFTVSHISGLLNINLLYSADVFKTDNYSGIVYPKLPYFSHFLTSDTHPSIFWRISSPGFHRCGQ